MLSWLCKRKDLDLYDAMQVVTFVLSPWKLILPSKSESRSVKEAACEDDEESRSEASPDLGELDMLVPTGSPGAKESSRFSTFLSWPFQPDYVKLQSGFNDLCAQPIVMQHVTNSAGAEAASAFAITCSAAILAARSLLLLAGDIPRLYLDLPQYEVDLEDICEISSLAHRMAIIVGPKAMGNLGAASRGAYRAKFCAGIESDKVDAARLLKKALRPSIVLGGESDRFASEGSHLLSDLENVYIHSGVASRLIESVDIRSVGRLIAASPASLVSIAAVWSPSQRDENRLYRVPPPTLRSIDATLPAPSPGLLRRLVRRLLGDPVPEPPTPPQAVLETFELIRAVGALAGSVATRQLLVVARRVNENLGTSRREDASLCPLVHADSTMVYACGRCWGSLGFASVERYSPLKREWEVVPPMLVPRQACAVASTGGKLYVMGGIARVTSTSREPSNEEDDLDVCPMECFDPVLCRWSSCPSVEISRSHAAAAAVGGAIYLVGGLSAGHSLSQAHRFRPDSGCWEWLAPMLTPRFESAATSAKGRLYVLGGTLESGEPLTTAERFDSRSGVWEALPPMPNHRFGCAAVATKGKIYALGGCSMGRILAEVDCFDPEQHIWFEIAPMPKPRNHCGAVVVANCIYVFGGNNHHEVARIDRLDLDEWIWHESGSMPRPQGTCIAAAVSC